MLPTCLLLVVGLAGAPDEEVPVRRMEVVAPKDEDIVIVGLNGGGEVVGYEWIEDKDRPGVLDQVPFVTRGDEVTYLPLLEGYTATMPAGLADGGRVAGRVSKPIPPGGRRIPLLTQAFVWDAEGGIRALRVLPGDLASAATGISRDGRRVSGYSVGDGRTRACVWDLAAGGGRWEPTALPQEGPLGSQVVVISGDGRRVAAVDGTVPCLWTRGEDGSWSRQAIGEAASLVPRAVNGAGTVVGLRHVGDGTTRAVVWSRGGGMRTIEAPKGFVRGEALAVNEADAVVGFVDGPGGSDIGPRAFVDEKGDFRLIDSERPGLVLTIAQAINDRGQVAGVAEKVEPEEPKGDAPEKDRPGASKP